MNRLLCFTLLFALFALPAHTQTVQTIPPIAPLIVHDDSGKKYTIKTPDMDYYDFMRAADAMVLERVPEWYVEGTPEMPIIMQASPNLLRSRYGEAWRDDQGVYHVRIGRLGLMLATVEDLASIVLHEFVHVLAWKDIEYQDWSENCMSARQELMANNIVIENYHNLGYTPYMLRNSHRLYQQARVKSILNGCPIEVMWDLPEVPVPRAPGTITSTEDSSLEPN